MYDLLSLSLKCPVCGESLMDKEHTVDNEPGIKLNYEMSEKRGTIWLSSIYGSYNFTSDIEDSQKDEVAKFFCPHCDTHITSESECLTCGAPMVPFYLDMGGKVSICSRSGCKNHFVEFDDLSVALRKLYQQYGFRGRAYPDEERLSSRETKPTEKEDEIIETIRTGTYINAYCFHCKKSLIVDDMLKLSINNDKGDSGFAILSPYLNVFTSKSSIYLPEDRVVEEACCIHCKQSLIVENRNCETCNSPLIKLAVIARTKMLDFYVCSKKGCKWHGLNEEDLQDIRLEDSLEW